MTKNGKYGFINIKGNVVVPVVYDYAGYYDDGSSWIKQDSLQRRVDVNGRIMRMDALSKEEKEWGEPDLVTPWSELYLKEKLLITNDFVGGYRGDRYRLALIHLDDIILVVKKEGSVGSVYKETFHTDSCSIETDCEELSIGSTQHDYYDYMDPPSSFSIITRNGRYDIDSHLEIETKTIWDWIVYYFKNKNEA